MTTMNNLVFDHMTNLFKSILPSSLTMDQYELHDRFEKFSPEEWEDFLDQPETYRFINSKVAKQSEIAARKAVHKLVKGNLQQGEIQAIRELLEKSKLLTAAHNAKPIVVMTYLPRSEKKGVEQ